MVSLASGDFNGDGQLDLAATDVAGDAFVYLGHGDGTFAAVAAPPLLPTPTPSSLLHLLSGDFDGDGRADLVALATNATSVSLFFGNRDGSFSPPTTLPLPFPLSDTYYLPAAVGDVDGDGRADLVVFTQDDDSSAPSGEIDTFSWRADRGIVAQRAPAPMPLVSWTNLALGDLDGDGGLTWPSSAPACSF